MDETTPTAGPERATATDPTSEAPTTVLPTAEAADGPTPQLPTTGTDVEATTELPVTSSESAPGAVEHEAKPGVDRPAAPAAPVTAPAPERPGGPDSGGTATGAAPAGDTAGRATATPPRPDLLSTTLQRSKDDRMISGVCGGLAKSLKIDALWLRLGLIVAVLLGFGVGLIVYLACWALMPLED